MASEKKTANYKLNKWSRTDGVNMADFNSDNDKIDAALGSFTNRAKIMVGSYKGTGTYGNANPTTLTFDFTPKIIWVMQDDYGSSGLYSFAAKNGQATARVYSDFFSSGTYGLLTLTWKENGVSWTIPENSSLGMNGSYTPYTYIALG